MDPRAASGPDAGGRNRRHGCGPAHGGREVPASEEPGTERAAPSGGPVAVRRGVAGHPPAGPPIELGLVDLLFGLGGPPRRRWQFPELVGKQIGEDLPVDEDSFTGEGPDTALVCDGLEGLVDTGLGELVVHGAGLAQAVAGVPDHVVDPFPRCFGGDQVVDDGSTPVSTGWHQ